MVLSKKSFTFYILILGILVFSKEFVIINQELIVILGFFGIFFTLKYFLGLPIKDALDAYSKQLKHKFVDFLSKLKILSDNVHQKSNVTILRLSAKITCFMLLFTFRVINLQHSYALGRTNVAKALHINVVEFKNRILNTKKRIARDPLRQSYESSGRTPFKKC